jgi:hypothetical protein
MVTPDGADSGLVVDQAAGVTTNAPATNYTAGGAGFTLPTGTNSATAGDLAEVIRAGAQQSASVAAGVSNLNAEGREGGRTNYTLPEWNTNLLSAAARVAAGEILEAGEALASASMPTGWGGLSGSQSWWQWTIIPAGSSVHPAGFVVNAYPPTLLSAIWQYLPWLKLFLGVLIGVAIFERALVQLGAALNESNPPGITCPNMTVTIAGFGGNAIGILWGLARAGVVGLQIGVVLLGGAALAGFVVVAGFSAFVATLSIPDWLGQPFWFISQIVPVEVLMFGMVCTFVLYGVRMTGLATGIVLRLMPS